MGRLALFANVYNMMIMHGYLEFGVTSSALKRLPMFAGLRCTPRTHTETHTHTHMQNVPRPCVNDSVCCSPHLQLHMHAQNCGHVRTCTHAQPVLHLKHVTVMELNTFLQPMLQGPVSLQPW